MGRPRCRCSWMAGPDLDPVAGQDRDRPPAQTTRLVLPGPARVGRWNAAGRRWPGGEGELAERGRTAAALGAWLVFEDEADLWITLPTHLTRGPPRPHPGRARAGPFPPPLIGRGPGGHKPGEPSRPSSDTRLDDSKSRLDRLPRPHPVRTPAARRPIVLVSVRYCGAPAWPTRIRRPTGPDHRRPARLMPAPLPASSPSSHDDITHSRSVSHTSVPTRPLGRVGTDERELTQI